MMIKNLVEKTRTVRRFVEEKTLPLLLLQDLVELARLSGSARNGQVLKYMIVTEEEQRKLVFPYLGWAGYLSDWKGPEPGERPAAYILCYLDKNILKGSEKEAQFDLGIATQSMLMGAAEQGIMGCRIGNFSPKLQEVFEVPEGFDLLLVLALGAPAEEVILELVGMEGDIKYWRDDKGKHHVPKRGLSEILLPSSVQDDDA